MRALQGDADLNPCFKRCLMSYMCKWESRYQSQSRAQCPDTCRRHSLDPFSKDMVQPWLRQQQGPRRYCFLVPTNRVMQRSWQKKKEKETCSLKWYVSLCVWTISYGVQLCDLRTLDAFGSHFPLAQTGAGRGVSQCELVSASSA